MYLTDVHMFVFQLCAICGDPFEQYWDEEAEEWHLRNAISVAGKVSCACHLVTTPEVRLGHFLCLLPVWNLRAVSLIPLFCISSLVLLPSPVALFVLSSSAFGPFF